MSVEAAGPPQENVVSSPSSDPRSLAMLARSFSRSGDAQASPEFMESLLEAVAPRMAELGPRGLAMLLHSVARSNHRADWFFAEAKPLAMALLCELDSQGLAMVLWAFAVGSGGLPMGDMCARACLEALPKLHAVTAESLEMAIEAFERAGESSEQLHEAWRRWVVHRSLTIGAKPSQPGADDSPTWPAAAFPLY
jgi:hypothetical protein